MKLKHAKNRQNLKSQRRQFLDEENEKLRMEIAVVENVQKRLFWQEKERGKCKIYVLSFYIYFQSVSGVYIVRKSCGSTVKYIFFIVTLWKVIYLLHQNSKSKSSLLMTYKMRLYFMWC